MNGKGFVDYKYIVQNKIWNISVKIKQLGFEIWRTSANKLFSSMCRNVSGMYILLFMREGCVMRHFFPWSLFVLQVCCCTVQINTSRNKYCSWFIPFSKTCYLTRFYNHWFTCTWGCVNPKWQRQNCVLLNNCTLCNTMRSCLLDYTCPIPSIKALTNNMIK